MDGGHHRLRPVGFRGSAPIMLAGCRGSGSLIPSLPDIGRQLPPQVGDVVSAADHGGDPHGPGLLGKGAVPEADQLGGDGFVQILQQTQHMGLGPAGIAAADEMDDLHKSASKKRGPCEIAENIIQ